MSWIQDALTAPTTEPPKESPLPGLPPKPTLPKPDEPEDPAPLTSSWIQEALAEPSPPRKREPEKPGLLKETGKALMRGFSSAGVNLLSRAPEAYLNFYEQLPEWAGGLPDNQRQTFEKGKKNLQEGWFQPFEEYSATAERYWASEDPDANLGFFEQLKKNPGRALAVGLAENTPQLLVTIGAAAVNPVAGMAVAGASEAGGAWQEAKQAGASDQDAAMAAGITALPNMVLEYLPAGALVRKVFKGVPKAEVAGVVRGILKQAMAEGSTEMLQEVNSVVAGLATYASDRGLSWNDVKSLASPENLQRYGAAGLMGAILGGGTDAAFHAAGEHAGPPAENPENPLRGKTIQVREQIEAAEKAAPPAPAPQPPAPQPRPIPQPPAEPAPAPAPPAPQPPTEKPPARVIPFPPQEPAPAPKAPAGEPSPTPQEPAPQPPSQQAPEAKETEPAKAPTPTETGSRGRAFTERGREVEFDYAVVEVGSLRTSHTTDLRPDPSYPQEVQPRDRSRATSEAQVSRIAGNLNPDLLGESPKVSDGAPVIGDDGVVESGNARGIALKRVYAKGGEGAERYQSWLRENSSRFGIDPERLQTFQEPVLVRVRRTEVDRAEFAREANEAAVATMSATERARSDAEGLTPEMVERLQIPESGEVNWTSPATREFVDSFMTKVVPSNEHGAMFDDRGELSNEGQQRIRNALLARAYGDADSIAKLIEHSDNNIRNVGNALMREAPRMVQLRTGIEQGSLLPLDISDDVTAALRKLSALRENGTKVGDYLNQTEMFGAELTPESRELLGAFDAHSRSSRQIADILRRYSEIAESLGDPNQGGLFGPRETPSKLEVLREAIRTKDAQPELPGAASAAGSAYLPGDRAGLPRRGGNRMNPPSSPPGPGPHRSVDTQPARRLVELPEIVEMLQELGKGRLPRVRRALRTAGGKALGAFFPRGQKSGVEVRADIAPDQQLSAEVLAHELGHWVDYVPGHTFSRGNILGHLASLKQYLRTMIDEVPTSPTGVLTKDERRKLRQASLREAKAQLGAKDPGVKARAAEIYRDKLQQEMGTRRLVDRDTIIEELRTVSRAWRGDFPNGDPYRDTNEELYADAFSALVNDPDFLKKHAPTFHSLFFNYLGRKPEVESIYNEIQQRIEAGPEAVYDKRLSRYVSMVKRGAAERVEALRRRRQEGASLAQALIDGLIDSKSEMYRRVRQARKAGASLDPDKNPLYWLEEIAYHSSQAAWYLDRFKSEVLDITREAGVSDDEFGAFLALRRSAGERGEMFNPLGEQGEFAKDLQNHLLSQLGKEKSDAVVKAARRWWELRKEVLDAIDVSGAFSKRVMRHARQHPEYVKFFVRLYMKEDRTARRGIGNIHQQFGTLQEIGNPVIETALADLALLRVAHRTQAARSVEEFMVQNFPKEIQQAKRGPGGRLVESKGRTIYYLKDGKAHAFYTTPRIASFFEQDPYRANAAYRAYNLLTRPLRALFVDRNPWWAFWNLYRDAKAFAKQVVTVGSPGQTGARRGVNAALSPAIASFETFRYLLKSIPDAAAQTFFKDRDWEWVERRSSDYREMLRDRMVVEMGGSVSDPYTHAGDANGEMNAILKTFGVVEATSHNAGVRVLQKLWDWAGRPGVFTEKLTKIAGYKYLRANQARLGLSDKEVSHRVRTLVGTPDVLRRGDWFKVTNSVWLFSNVGKEGLRSAFEAAKLSPAEYTMKTLAFDVLPKLAMAAAAAGFFGDELEKWFDRVSEYDKSNFLILPLGTTPSGKAVYTRIPHDHVGQLVSGLVWRAFTDRKSVSSLFDWMNQNFPYSFGAFHPYLTSAWATAQYAQGHNPQDPYSGQPMVRDERVFRAGGMKSHVAFAKALWSEVGLDVLVKFSTEQSSEVAAYLEKALSWPIAGPALARFVKVSDYGTEERLRDLREEEQAEQAERSLALDDIVREGLREDPEATVYELYRAARDAGLDPGKKGIFARRVAKLRSRMSGDRFERHLSSASKRERAEIEELREEIEFDQEE